MRSVTQSLNLFTTALGSWAVIPVLLMVNANPSKCIHAYIHTYINVCKTWCIYIHTYLDDEWVPRNVDQGHLDWYFFLLSGLMALSLVGLTYYIHIHIHTYTHLSVSVGGVLLHLEGLRVQDHGGAQSAGRRGLQLQLRQPERQPGGQKSHTFIDTYMQYIQYIHTYPENIFVI